MPGLVPGIYGKLDALLRRVVDGRDEPGHDEKVKRLSGARHYR